MPRISPIVAASWLAFGTLAIGILLPAPMAPHPAAGPSRRAAASVAVVPATYLVGPSIFGPPDPALARLNALVWRRGQRPPQQASTSTLSPDQNINAPRKNANGLVVSAIQATRVATQNDQRSVPPHDAAHARMVATTAVNVHVSPGSAAKLFTLQQGESVEVVASQSLWVNVKTASGGGGWVYSNYLAPE